MPVARPGRPHPVSQRYPLGLLPPCKNAKKLPSRLTSRRRTRESPDVLPWLAGRKAHPHIAPCRQNRHLSVAHKRGIVAGPRRLSVGAHAPYTGASKANPRAATATGPATMARWTSACHAQSMHHASHVYQEAAAAVLADKGRTQALVALVGDEEGRRGAILYAVAAARLAGWSVSDLEREIRVASQAVDAALDGV